MPLHAHTSIRGYTGKWRFMPRIRIRGCRHAFALLYRVAIKFEYVGRPTPSGWLTQELVIICFKFTGACWFLSASWSWTGVSTCTDASTWNVLSLQRKHFCVYVDWRNVQFLRRNSLFLAWDPTAPLPLVGFLVASCYTPSNRVPQASMFICGYEGYTTFKTDDDVHGIMHGRHSQLEHGVSFSRQVSDMQQKGKP